MEHTGSYNTRTRELGSASGAPLFFDNRILIDIFDGPIDVTRTQEKERGKRMSYVNSSKYEGTVVESYKTRVAQLEEALVVARKDLRNAEHQHRMDLLDKLGDGAVIRWTRDFMRGKEYIYAAVRADGYWYISGSEDKKTTKELKTVLTYAVELHIMTPDKEV